MAISIEKKNKESLGASLFNLLKGKKAIIAILIFIGLAFIAYQVQSNFAKSDAAKSAAKAKQAEIVPVTVATAKMAVLPLEIRNIGNVEAFSVVNVTAQVGGLLTDVYFKQGQYVKKGDLLFQIDGRPYEAQLDQAEANVSRDKSQINSASANLDKDMAMCRQAQANSEKDLASQKYADVEVQRYASLVQEGAVSHEQADQIKTNAETARATVNSDKAVIENAQAVIASDKAAVLTARANLKADQAAADNLRIQLGFTKIFSPVDGNTGALNVNQGNVVRANDTAPLVTINQIQPIYVTFSVPEIYLPSVRQSMTEGTIQVSARVGGDKKITVSGGTLTFIDNTVDKTTGTIRLRATFPNDNKLLWPGEFTDVIVVLPGAKPQIIIPTSAVVNDQQGQSVFVVRPTNTVDLVNVTVDRTHGDNSIISTGLKEGDIVVVDGQMKLLPDSPVNIIQNSPPASIAPITTPTNSTPSPATPATPPNT